MNEVFEVFRSFRESSRPELGRTYGKGQLPSVEDLNCGSLQRIADAVENIAQILRADRNDRKRQESTAFVLARYVPESNPCIDARDIAEIGLPVEVATRLGSEGISTLGHLIRLSADELRAINRFGSRRLGLVRIALRKLGLRLYRDPIEPTPAAEDVPGAPD